MMLVPGIRKYLAVSKVCADSLHVVKQPGKHHFEVLTHMSATARMNDSPSALFRFSSLMARHDALYLAHITCASVSRGCIPCGKLPH